MKYKRRILALILPVLAVYGLFAQTAPTYAIDCAILPSNICQSASSGSGTDVKSSGIFQLILLVLNIMTAGIGIAAVGAIIYAGILYSSAQGSSEQVAKAKTVIRNTVIGIVAYGLMFVALQWLIPGGVFG